MEVQQPLQHKLIPGNWHGGDRTAAPYAAAGRAGGPSMSPSACGMPTATAGASAGFDPFLVLLPPSAPSSRQQQQAQQLPSSGSPCSHAHPVFSDPANHVPHCTPLSSSHPIPDPGFPSLGFVDARPRAAANSASGLVLHPSSAASATFSLISQPARPSVFSRCDRSSAFSTYRRPTSIREAPPCVLGPLSRVLQATVGLGHLYHEVSSKLEAEAEVTAAAMAVANWDGCWGQGGEDNGNGGTMPTEHASRFASLQQRPGVVRTGGAGMRGSLLGTSQSFHEDALGGKHQHVGGRLTALQQWQSAKYPLQHPIAEQLMQQHLFQQQQQQQQQLQQQHLFEKMQGDFVIRPGSHGTGLLGSGLYRQPQGSIIVACEGSEGTGLSNRSQLSQSSGSVHVNGTECFTLPGGQLRVGPHLPLLGGRFRYLESLSEGGSAKVFTALDMLHPGRRIVVVKAMHKHYREVGLQEQQLLRYLNAMDPDDSCHIVRLVSGFDFAGHTCLVLERLQGSLLDHMCSAERQALSPAEKVEEIRCLALHLIVALAMLHTAGVIHGDLKPENVLLQASCARGRMGGAASPTFSLMGTCPCLISSSSLPSSCSGASGHGASGASWAEAAAVAAAGRGSTSSAVPPCPGAPVGVKLADFGNSFTPEQIKGLCRDYNVQTLAYRSPEVLLGVPFDSRIDMWSLGCIIAELAIGRLLFACDCPAQLLQQMVAMLGLAPPQALFGHGKFFARLFSEAGLTPANGLGHAGPAGGTASPMKVNFCSPGRSYLGDVLLKVDPQLADLVSGLLQYDPACRLTAHQALMHPFFSPLFPFRALFGGPQSNQAYVLENEGQFFVEGRPRFQYQPVQPSPEQLQVEQQQQLQLQQHQQLLLQQQQQQQLDMKVRGQEQLRQVQEACGAKPSASLGDPAWLTLVPAAASPLGIGDLALGSAVPSTPLSLGPAALPQMPAAVQQLQYDQAQLEMLRQEQQQALLHHLQQQHHHQQQLQLQRGIGVLHAQSVHVGQQCVFPASGALGAGWSVGAPEHSLSPPSAAQVHPAGQLYLPPDQQKGQESTGAAVPSNLLAAADAVPAERPKSAHSFRSSGTGGQWQEAGGPGVQAVDLAWSPAVGGICSHVGPGAEGGGSAEVVRMGSSCSSDDDVEVLGSVPPEHLPRNLTLRTFERPKQEQQLAGSGRIRLLQIPPAAGWGANQGGGYAPKASGKAPSVLVGQAPATKPWGSMPAEEEAAVAGQKTGGSGRRGSLVGGKHTLSRGPSSSDVGGLGSGASASRKGGHGFAAGDEVEWGAKGEGGVSEAGAAEGLLGLPAASRSLLPVEREATAPSSPYGFSAHAPTTPFRGSENKARGQWSRGVAKVYPLPPEQQQPQPQEQQQQQQQGSMTTVSGAGSQAAGEWATKGICQKAYSQRQVDALQSQQQQQQQQHVGDCGGQLQGIMSRGGLSHVVASTGEQLHDYLPQGQDFQRQQAQLVDLQYRWLVESHQAYGGIHEAMVASAGHGWAEKSGGLTGGYGNELLSAPSALLGSCHGQLHGIQEGVWSSQAAVL